MKTEEAFGKLLVLLAEQLRGSLVDQHGGDRGHNGFGQHIAAVVGQAEGPSGKTVAQVAPNQHAGEEAAQKTDAAHGSGTHGNARQLVLKGLGNAAGQTQQAERQHIVQQNHTHQGQQTRGRGCVKAQQHLQQAVYKAGEQTPLDAVAEGDQHERQHTEQGDGTAVGQLVDFDVRQNGAQGDHQGALDQSAGLGIGFGHTDTSFYNST